MVYPFQTNGYLFQSGRILAGLVAIDELSAPGIAQADEHGVIDRRRHFRHAGGRHGIAIGNHHHGRAIPGPFLSDPGGFIEAGKEIGGSGFEGVGEG